MEWSLAKYSTWFWYEHDVQREVMEKVEITISIVKDSQTAKAVLDYDQVVESRELFNLDVVKETIEALRLEIERGI